MKHDCKICGSIFNSANSLGVHVSRTHNMKAKDYYMKYIMIYKENECIKCGKETKYRGLTIGFSNFCSLKCKGGNKRKTPIIKESIYECKLCKHKSNTPHGLGRHITSKHDMTTEEYHIKYDLNNEQPVCHRKGCEEKTNFRGLGTGFSKYCSCKCVALCEEQQEKANKTLKEKYGEEVTNRFQLTHSKEKMKQTNLERYGSEYYADSKEGRIRLRNTMEKSGLWIPYEQLEDFDKYRRQVEKYTAKNRIYLKNYDKRGRYNYHVDHRYSVYDGFKNNIVPWILGSLYNLEMLPCDENLRKNNKSSITKKELMENWKIT